MLRTLTFVVLFTLSSLAQPVKVDYAEVELISEVKSVSPGNPFWIALRIDHDEYWHTYWRNAGDAGIPTKIKWDLPNGFTAGQIQWPFPKRIMLADVANFGFENELVLPVLISPPKTLNFDENITIKAKATWLICKEECLPGKAELKLTLPVSNEIIFDEKWTDAFNEIRNKLPLTNHSWDTNLGSITDSSISFNIQSESNSLGDEENIFFFPYEQGFIKNSSDQVLTKFKNGYTLLIGLEDFIVNKPDTLKGILVSEFGWRGENSERAIEIKIPITNLEQTVSSNEQEDISIWLAIIFAFAGGIILNLMPCVLPVLSIKILGFVQQSGEDKSKIFQHGVFFTVGVVISFLVLAGILLILRAGGEQLGWGFQLQSPLFLIILSILLLVFALSLFGVFEIGSSAGKIGGKLEQKNGNFGAILSGVAATVLATPCTAPFMGSALGFAITQPTFITLGVFTSLGLGMAFPYLLLSIFPQWLKFIPKPGNWMNTLKQFMGFLLLATIVWLAWVLSIQAGSDAVIGLLAGLLIAGLAGWIFGRWGSIINKKYSRLTATIISVLLITFSVYLANSFVSDTPTKSYILEKTDSLLPWEKFSQNRLDELIANGDRVFIDFTAAWCLSCQVNEKIALNIPKVVNKFDELNVTPLKADWTSRDQEITKALSRFGRNSVPLYILYDSNGNYEKLPEILTPRLVLEYLENLK
jgi:thiol:disulfide interchange protein/DsbC/DsbD-like thiol-disulfide interchange protein